eukprot:COSAG06_NODE_3040_length_5924_cov_41.632446_7_plen_128_part_00
MLVLHSGLLGSCVATSIDVHPEPLDSEEVLRVPAAGGDPGGGGAGKGKSKSKSKPPSETAALSLTGSAAACSLDLTKPLRCPAPGGKHVCVSSYIECLRWLHGEEAAKEGCELGAGRDLATRKWACP